MAWFLILRLPAVYAPENTVNKVNMNKNIIIFYPEILFANIWCLLSQQDDNTYGEKKAPYLIDFMDRKYVL